MQKLFILSAFISIFIFYFSTNQKNELKNVNKNHQQKFYIKTKLYLDTFDIQTNQKDSLYQVQKKVGKNANILLKKILDSLGQLYQYEIYYLTKDIKECKGACYAFSIKIKQSKSFNHSIVVNAFNPVDNQNLTSITFSVDNLDDQKRQSAFCNQISNFVKILCVPTNFKVRHENDSTNKKQIIIGKIKNKNRKEYIDLLNFHTYNSISFFSNEVNRGAKKKKIYNYNIYQEGEVKNINKNTNIIRINIEKETKDSVFITYKGYEKGTQIFNHIIILPIKDIQNGNYTNLLYKNYNMNTGSKSILR